jgi:hypothetical protein
MSAAGYTTATGARRGARVWWHYLAAGLPALSLAATALTVVGGARPAAAGARVAYAYATGTSAALGCSPEHDPVQGCSLAQALAEASAGATVALATPGAPGTTSATGRWLLRALRPSRR